MKIPILSVSRKGTKEFVIFFKTKIGMSYNPFIIFDKVCQPANEQTLFNKDKSFKKLIYDYKNCSILCFLIYPGKITRIK